MFGLPAPRRKPSDAASSSRLPTSGASSQALERRRASRTRSRRYAGQLRAFPSASSGSTASTSTSVLARGERAFLAEQDLAGLGACSRRAATLTASPVTSASPPPATHFAGVDADPRLEAESSDGVAKLCRSTKRTKRIVLVERRDPEDRHHGVADELLHRAAMALQSRPCVLEERD